MSDLLAARAQMGTSLAFHIIFASLGIGLPLLLCIAEGLALWRKDATWMTLTRRWTKAFALLFAIGVVYRQRQLLDEYANRFPDYAWAGDWDQSLTGYTQSEHPV